MSADPVACGAFRKRMSSRQMDGFERVSPDALSGPAVESTTEP